MTNTIFKKTVFISILGHITIFSIFSFSFGNTIHKPDYAGVSFWGQFLRNSQVSQPIIIPRRDSLVRELSFRPPDTSLLDRVIKESPESSRYYFKPPLSLSFNPEKEIFTKAPKTLLFSSRRREPAIVFHPLLPYGFTLYFKDRQVAHVELMFKIASAGPRDSAAIKRKISSGNLEVDLLTMRYIGHYLFIQRPKAASDNWQTVKIDLSAAND
jgi:hypothetical protein